jgi:tetratricopeptide (TPR) repeat protein
MKKLALITFLFSAVFLFRANAASYTDSTQVTTYNSSLDSLKQVLKSNQYDSLKAGIYAQIAAQYLKYDTITNKKIKASYQNEAINYTMQALHGYSRYNDTLGMRTCFDNLTKVYRSQKKYSQAKWFVLQSNTISRAIDDKPNIIASLLELAGIKMDIKDYSLAIRDLNEALKLSVDNHFASTEAKVQENYALYYSRTKHYTKEAMALKRRDFIYDSLAKAQKAMLAKAIVQDSVQSKKKSLITRKTNRLVSLKRIASL